MPPTVSVVIPYYNDSSFIDEAVASVFAQTRPPEEIIIVDDGSREEEFQYLCRFDKTCIIVRNRLNMGLAAARNAGVARASCEWIAPLDADDLWEPTKLGKQLAYVEQHPDCVAVHTAVRRRHVDGAETVYHKGPVGLRECLFGIFNEALIPSLLMKRSEMLLAGLFDPTQRYSEDREFLVRFCLHNTIHYIDEALLIVRQRSMSLSKHWEQMWVYGNRINRNYRHLFPGRKAYRQALLRLNAHYLVQAIYRGAYGVAWRVLRQITARDLSMVSVALRALSLLVRDRSKPKNKA